MINLIEFATLKNIDSGLLDKDFSSIPEITTYKKLVNYKKKKNGRVWTDLEIDSEKKTKPKNKKRSKEVIDCISAIVKKLDVEEDKDLIGNFKSLRTTIYESVFADKDAHFVVTTGDKKKIITSVNPIFGHIVTYRLEDFKPTINILAPIEGSSPETFVLKEDAGDFIEKLKKIWNAKDHSIIKMTEIVDEKNTVNCNYSKIEFEPKNLQVMVMVREKQTKRDSEDA